MRHILAAVLSAALVATPAFARPRLSPEAELAEAVKGRVAGEPVSCINLSRVRQSRIIDRTAIVYDAGNVIYVNRPRRGADQLDSWDTLVTQLPLNRLCRPDLVRLYDGATRIVTGSVALGDFVPYRRVPRQR